MNTKMLHMAYNLVCSTGIQASFTYLAPRSSAGVGAGVEAEAASAAGDTEADASPWSQLCPARRRFVQTSASNNSSEGMGDSFIKTAV